MGSGHSGVAVVITTTKSEQTADSSSSVSVMSLMTRSSHFCWTVPPSQHFPPIPESLLLLAEQQFLSNSAAFAGIAGWSFSFSQRHTS